MEERHYLRVELYQQMAENPAFFDFLQHGSLDGIWYWDLENPEQEWMSPEFWLVLGFDPSEKQHLAAEWKNLMFPEDLRTTTENFERHLENPDYPYDQVVRFHHKRGHTVWIRCRGMAYRDPETGTPLRMLGVHADLTKMMDSQEMAAALRLQVETLKMQIETLQMQKRMLLDRLKDAGADPGALADG